MLGFYSDGENDTITEGTKSFKAYDSYLSGKLTNLLDLTKPLKPGKARVYFGTEKCSVVSLASLGKKDAVENNEQIDVLKENVRRGISAGMDALKELGIENVEVDLTEHPTAASEGAHLAAWKYKETERQKYPKNISPIETLPDQSDHINVEDSTGEWNEGKIFAEGQNFCRHLMNSPGNLMTPTIFCNSVKENIEACGTRGTIEVKIRDKEWIENQSMGSFLSVAKGSDEQPKFLEIHYTGPGCTHADQPLVLIGKGITFDTGGISIKPAARMEAMRADMGGAANVSCAIYTAAKLNVKAKVIGLMPLCENMLNGNANKPGDVVTAKDGTTIQIDNTDAEGRLILADALCYAREFQPSAIVDLATLTGSMVVALGGGAAGIFTNSDNLWSQFHQAGYMTGDRVWRMPIFQVYMDQIKPSLLADINNVGMDGGKAGACTAAMFLNHFVEDGTPWAHLDIAGVFDNEEYIVPYLGKGMSGRPVRTLVQFVRNYFS